MNCEGTGSIFGAPVEITPNVGLIANPLDGTRLFAPLFYKKGR